MTLLKINIFDIIDSLNTTSWSVVKNEINKLTNFITNDEQYKNLSYKNNDKRVFSFDNFKHADVIKVIKINEILIRNNANVWRNSVYCFGIRLEKTT